MSLRSILLGLALLVGVTIATAIVQGRNTNRWGVPEDLNRAASRLAKIPENIGDWRHVAEGEPLRDRVASELGLSGHLTRVYRHAATGNTISLLLMAGEPGPLVRHPPTLCYQNRGHRQLGAIEHVTLEGTGKPSDFGVLRFTSAGVTGEQFLVAYAFSTGQKWSLPRMPRLTFGGERHLFKVQVLYLVTRPNEDPAQSMEVLTKFLSDFVAAAPKALFEPQAPD